MAEDLGPHPIGQALLRLLPRGEVAAKYRAEMHEREQRRAEQLAAVVSETVDLETLLQRVTDDEELGEMFRLAVDAATRSTSNEQIRLLGSALASGALAKDQAVVDEATQLLRVAAEMDPVDVRAVLVLDELRSTYRPWSDLATALPATDATVFAVLARLRRAGLLDSEAEATIGQVDSVKDLDTVEVEERWSLTPTARALLRLLETRSSATSESEGVRS